MVTNPVVLEVEGIKITGQLYLPGNGDRIPYHTVCVCHGIPARVPSGDRGYPLLAERICREGFAVFIFNFRGTGSSGGNLDMAGWTRDLRAVIDYLSSLPQVDKAHLSLLGFSGGAAVSVYLAAQDKRVSSVIACACPAEFTLSTVGDAPALLERFRSIGVIRDKGFPHSLQEWFDGFKLVRPVEFIAGIAPRPLLLVHGSQDETVNVSHAHRLYERAGEPKQIVVVEGAGHRLRQSEEAMAAVLGWLKAQSKSTN